MSRPLEILTPGDVMWDRMTSRSTKPAHEDLGAFDIAETNLVLAQGPPGTEHLDAAACLRQFDLWIHMVHDKTEEWRPGFLRSPATYAHSEGKFRMTALVTVLQRHLGVRYNLAFSEGDYDASDSRNLFLHGLLSGHGGTCVTMPVLYVSVGRRLGYPSR